MKIDLPYLFQDVDRHGNIRHYVRKKIGGKHRRVRLAKPPGSPTSCPSTRPPLAV
jgi:hypothetical protein